MPRRNRLKPAVLLLALLGALSAHAESAPAWPQWRGPLGTGVAPEADPPIRWSEQENLRWKLPLPGLGHSTPVIWGDRLFLTTAVETGEMFPADAESEQAHDHDDGAHDNLVPQRRMEFIVIAVDRRDGTVLWQRTLKTARPHEGTHVTGSWASNSPVTDGEHLIVSFGSIGLFALDLDGKTVWEKDLGDMSSRHGHGEGSSPALHGDTLVVNWDHQGESFVLALDKRTGKERWRTVRDEMTSWSTPLIVDAEGKQQVVISATGAVRSYDLATGRQVWFCRGLSRNVVASPVAADGMVFVANSYDWQAMLAIRVAGASGDITGTEAVAWTRNRDTPYVPSPILYDDTLCYLKHYQGFLTCVDPATGRPRFELQRLPGIRNVFASPVGAAGRIYIVDRDGNALVFRKGQPFEVLARNRLDDGFSASPAIVGDTLYLRGERFLYAIAEAPATE